MLGRCCGRQSKPAGLTTHNVKLKQEGLKQSSGSRSKSLRHSRQELGRPKFEWVKKSAHSPQLSIYNKSSTHLHVLTSPTSDQAIHDEHTANCVMVACALTTSKSHQKICLPSFLTRLNYLITENVLIFSPFQAKANKPFPRSPSHFKVVRVMERE